MTYSPRAISALYPLLEQHLSSTRRSGIAADKAGYHNSRNRLRGVKKWRSDYSISEKRDQLGDGDAASALDVALDQPQLKLVCQRLMAASLARDPRLTSTVREWFGSYTGRSVIGYSLFRRRPATSDSSHKWHLHLSGWRDKSNDAAAWLGVCEVLLGLPAGQLSGRAPAPAIPGAPSGRVVYVDKLNPGQRDSDSVRWVQIILGVPVTGTYDAATVAAVKRRQAAWGDDVIDGDLGALGAAALLLEGKTYALHLEATS
jgi:hypothetical protein